MFSMYIGKRSRKEENTGMEDENHNITPFIQLNPRFNEQPSFCEGIKWKRRMSFHRWW